MRKSPSAARRADRITTLILAVLTGTGALTAAALILAVAASALDMSESAVRGMSGIALAAGCFACAFCTANRRRRNGLASGLVCGIAVFFIAVIIGALTVKIFSAAGIFTKLLIIICASALGGYQGVNTKPVFRR